MPFAATWVEVETLILSEVSQNEKDKYHMIPHICNLIYSTNEPFPRKENHGLGEQTCGCQGGEREGMGWTGSLGLIDVLYCLWNGLAMRSCSVALRTISSHL